MAGPGDAGGPHGGESGAMTDQLAIPTAALRTVTAADLPALSGTLAAAFHDDPVFAWWIDDDARRREILPAFFRVIAAAHLTTGEVHAAAGLSSVAVWSPPGAEDDEALAGAVADVTAEYTERAFELLERTAERHPTDPHWYLFLLGTRPGHRSRGLGSALMRPVLERCDASGMPAYLEATSERGRELYRRHGFDVVDEIRLPQGPSLWPMWREAR